MVLKLFKNLLIVIIYLIYFYIFNIFQRIKLLYMTVMFLNLDIFVPCLVNLFPCFILIIESPLGQLVLPISFI